MELHGQAGDRIGNAAQHEPAAYSLNRYPLELAIAVKRIALKRPPYVRKRRCTPPDA